MGRLIYARLVCGALLPISIPPDAHGVVPSAAARNTAPRFGMTAEQLHGLSSGSIGTSAQLLWHCAQKARTAEKNEQGASRGHDLSLQVAVYVF